MPPNLVQGEKGLVKILAQQPMRPEGSAKTDRNKPKRQAKPGLRKRGEQKCESAYIVLSLLFDEKVGAVCPDETRLENGGEAQIGG